MGWLGWPPDTALDTPLPLVALALKGRVGMLKALRGDPPPKSDEMPDRATLAKRLKVQFRAMARKHKRKADKAVSDGG